MAKEKVKLSKCSIMLDVREVSAVFSFEDTAIINIVFMQPSSTFCKSRKRKYF